MQCQVVYIACMDERLKRIPYWSQVHRGHEYNGCRIVFSSPPECFLTPTTRVEFVEWCEHHERELNSNVRIDEVCSKTGRRTFIYPKRVYHELKKLYLEPMIQGEVPHNVGVILTGPPGTGKTSLAKLVARILGVTTFYIKPDTILSKYVGDSEKRLREILEKAKASEPSVVILDDAEWLLSARKLSEAREHTGIILDLQNILFEELPEIYKEKKRVLVIAATNLKPSELDIAFVRYERFGDPLFIPLPDYEALYTVLSTMLDKGAADKLARKCVNLGLSIADAIDMARKMKKGLPVERRLQTGRGYTRIHVDPVPGFEKIFDYFPYEPFRRRSRLFFHVNEEVGAAIVAQIAYLLKKPIIRVIDARYVDEAVHTANMLESIMLSSTRLPREIQDYIDNNADGPVIFLGKRLPEVATYPFFTIHELRAIVTREPILRAVLAYKQVKVDDVLVKKIVNETSSPDKFEAVLEAIVTLGYIDEKVLSRLAVFGR